MLLNHLILDKIFPPINQNEQSRYYFNFAKENKKNSQFMYIGTR
jgi:hypothetical protein